MDRFRTFTIDKEGGIITIYFDPEWSEVAKEKVYKAIRNLLESTDPKTGDISLLKV